MKYNPNRTLAILGLARAEAAIDDKKQAVFWYKKFIEQYADSDDRETLHEATNYIGIK